MAGRKEYGVMSGRSRHSHVTTEYSDESIGAAPDLKQTPFAAPGMSPAGTVISQKKAKSRKRKDKMS